MNQGHLQAAATHLRTALRLNPNDAVARDNLQRVLKAEATGQPKGPICGDWLRLLIGTLP